MPNGKPAGLACVQLDDQRRCKIFGHPERPAVCSQLKASADMCGTENDGGRFALTFLARLETLTRPD
jgi:hypothetical protein